MISPFFFVTENIYYYSTVFIVWFIISIVFALSFLRVDPLAKKAMVGAFDISLAFPLSNAAGKFITQISYNNHFFATELR
jgi:hypothetical protein